MCKARSMLERMLKSFQLRRKMALSLSATKVLLISLIIVIDWRKLFNNLFVSLNFPDEWTGKRIKDEWTDATAGGFSLLFNRLSKVSNEQNLGRILKVCNKSLVFGQCKLWFIKFKFRSTERMERPLSCLFLVGNMMV